MPFDFTIKAGGTAPVLAVQLKNDKNSVIDITAAKGATFYLFTIGGGARLNASVTSSVTDSVNGKISYNWSVNDTSGFDDTYVVGEFLITKSDNTIIKAPDDGFIKGYIVSALG